MGTTNTVEAGVTGCESSEDDATDGRKPQDQDEAPDEKLAEPPEKRPRPMEIESDDPLDDAENDDALDEESEEEESCEREPGSGKTQDALGRDVPPFILLDKTLTLQENLRSRAIMEYPVLHIALPKEVALFQ